MYPMQQSQQPMQGQPQQPSPGGQIMYSVGQPALHPVMQQQATPDIAQPPPDDAYKQALIQQLSSMGGGTPGQQPNTGAGASLSAMGSVIGDIAHAYKSKPVQNWVLNNTNGGQQGWATTVIPGE